MHEMSIVEGIVDISLNHSKGKKVISVDVEIGRLSSVVPEALEFCFDACSKDTELEGATLNIVRIDAAARCLDCKKEFKIESLYDGCSFCGGYRVDILRGEEMRVAAIEVED